MAEAPPLQVSCVGLLIQPAIWGLNHNMLGVSAG